MNIYIFLYGAIGFVLGLPLYMVSKRIVKFKSIKRQVEFIGKNKKDEYTLTLIACIFMSAITIISYYSFFEIYQIVFIIFFSMCAIIGTIIDNWIRIIPNELVITMAISGIIFQFIQGGVRQVLLSLITAICIGICFGIMMILFRLFGKTNTAMGAGDLKLLLSIAIICNFTNILVAILIMAMSMAAFCVVGLYIGVLNIKSYFPMCGFIMFGMIASLIPFTTIFIQEFIQGGIV